MRERAQPPLAPAGGVRRILVIRRKALGDALVSLPAVLRLSTAFPRAQLDLVVDRPYAPLLAGLARGVRVLAWPSEADRSPGAWTRRLRAAGYDLVIDYLGSPRTALWTALSGAPLRVGYDLRGRGWAYNVRVPRNRSGTTPLAEFAGEGFLDPLRALGLPAAPWTAGDIGTPPPQAWGETYAAWRRDWLMVPRPRIGLALSATWSAKAWPAREAAALYRLAAAEGASPLLVPGPGDEASVNAFVQEAREARLAPPTSLPELADLLGSLDVLVATDCGARHLAATLRVPTVTLFGPTDPRGWNPEHPDHVAVRIGEPCSPCDLTVCPVDGHPCMTRLTADRVWVKVQALLARRASGSVGRSGS